MADAFPAAHRQRELYLVCRGAPILLLALVGIGVPCVALALPVPSCSPAPVVAPWLYVLGLLCAVTTAAFVGAFVVTRCDRVSAASTTPGSAAYVPALAGYLGSVVWLCLGTILLAAAPSASSGSGGGAADASDDVSCSALRQRAVTVVICAWAGLGAVALLQTAASLVLPRQLLPLPSAAVLASAAFSPTLDQAGGCGAAGATGDLTVAAAGAFSVDGVAAGSAAAAARPTAPYRPLPEAVRLWVLRRTAGAEIPPSARR